MPQDTFINCIISNPIGWGDDWIVLHCPQQMEDVCLDGPSFDDNNIKFEGQAPQPGIYRCTIVANWSGIGLDMFATELDCILSFEPEWVP